MTSLWLASSIIKTSKRVTRGSKFSTTRESGMTQTGTAPRHSLIFRAEAARKMSECRGAVPVWVMPLSRVVENFDPRVTRFDVLIIDEASQSDVMALVALYLGKTVLVVGDHEQVSPSAVGQDLGIIQNLIFQHLPRRAFPVCAGDNSVQQHDLL